MRGRLSRMNKALYVKLDDETWAALQRLATDEQREMGAQASVVLRDALRRSTAKLPAAAAAR